MFFFCLCFIMLRLWSPTEAAECIETKLESWDYAFSMREVGTKKIVSMSVKHKDSRSGCLYGYGYGFLDSRAWVNHGCRATFTICLADCIETELDSWIPQRDVKALNLSEGQAVRSMSVNHQTSAIRGECVEGESFGFSGANAWVSKGCRAEFTICFGECETIELQSPRGFFGYGTDSKIPQSGGKVISMSLNEQFSQYDCTFGDSYGFDDDRVWANGGCMGNFSVCVVDQSDNSSCIDKIIESIAYEMSDEVVEEGRTVGSMRVKDQLSLVTGDCKDGVDYRHEDNLFVSAGNGCQAVFNLGIEECRNETLTSTSWFTPVTKYANEGETIVSMELLQEISSLACFSDSSYKYNSEYVTVQFKCQGVFKICYSFNEEITLKSTARGKSEVIDPEKNILSMDVRNKVNGSASCTLDNTYGFHDKTAWVDQDCSADFTICLERECREEKLESWGYKYASRELSETLVIHNMTVKKKDSSSACNYGNSYGYSGREGWVNHGCRATFTVCFKECGDQALESQPRQLSYVREFITQRPAEHVVTMTVSKQLSDAPCTLNKTFGYELDTAWVDEGCGAEFVIGYEEQVCVNRSLFVPTTINEGSEITSMTLVSTTSSYPCTLGKTFGMDGDVAWTSNSCYGTFTICYQDREVVSLQSPGYEGIFHDVRPGQPIVSMEVVDLISNVTCSEGESFGFVGDRPWVDRGCRALFSVCYEEKR